MIGRAYVAWIRRAVLVRNVLQLGSPASASCAADPRSSLAVRPIRFFCGVHRAGPEAAPRQKDAPR